MTPVSRYKLAPDVESRIIDTFLSELAKTTDVPKTNALMSLLLSQSEKIMLAKRLVAFVMIDKQIPDTQISKTLHLTRITVAKLRLTYTLSKERKEEVVKIIQSPILTELLKPIMKQFLDYAISASMGKIPKPKFKF